MADREVEPNRIDGIEAPQRVGDVSGHPPAGARVAGQAEAAADADHVRIERHDELRGRHAAPDAEVDPIVLAFAKQALQFGAAHTMAQAMKNEQAESARLKAAREAAKAAAR